MFDAKSRYAKIPDAYYTAPDGTQIAWRPPRIPPPSGAMTIQGSVSVGPVDRLDNVAARVLGDPEMFWQIADANDALDPFELARPGRRLKIPAIRF